MVTRAPEADEPGAPGAPTVFKGGWRAPAPRPGGSTECRNNDSGRVLPPPSAPPAPRAAPLAQVL